MSNIIKWNYISFDQTEKHLIDSDHSEKIKDTIIGEINSANSGIYIRTPQDLVDDFLHKGDEAEKPSVFTEGMPIVNYDKMMEEEREQIALEADSILAEAKKKAASIIEEAEAEAASIKEEAFSQGKEEGYEAGMKDGRKSIQKKEAELETQKEQLEIYKEELNEEFNSNLEQLEPFFADLTISLVEKLTGILLDEREELILYLIEKGMEEAGKSRQFTVHVSGEDMAFVAGRKSSLEEKLPENTELEIFADLSLEKGQCIIETDKKMIDASLDIKLRNLSEDLRMLSIV